MSQNTDLPLRSLARIASNCARETERFFRRQAHNPGYCFEMFRRAIMNRNQYAWELIYDQYYSIVSGWVKRHSQFPESGEEVQYFVNRAFEKIWVALTPAKFNDIVDLKSVLRYLQMCVHSVIIDYIRTNVQNCLDIVVDESIAENQPEEHSAEDHVLRSVHKQALWQELRARIHNDKEWRVIYGSFVLGLKPRELYAQFRDEFCDVNEIYRIKENVMARLRRDSEFKKILGYDA